MKTVIVIPTYNEADNIAGLLDALHAQQAAVTSELSFLIVDDNSPDGTADLVREYRERSQKVELIVGEKRGLGAAYVRGIRYALDHLDPDVIMEMDADFSHDPADLPRLLGQIQAGYDFVIGSRYVDDGSIPAEWTLFRRLNSRVGNMVARYVAGIYRVRDCTAGFRAIRASLLQSIDLATLDVQGYAFQVALLHRAVTAGASVKEVPVHFVDRTHGESKLGLSDIVEFIINAWWIRLQSSKTFIKFALVGATGVVVNLGAFTLLLNAGMNKFLASPIAIELSIISNFLLNNYWTFRWRRTRDRTRIKGLKFNLVSVLALAVSYSTFIISTWLVPIWPPQVHQAIGIVPALFINYFLNSYWTFRHVPRGER